MITAINDKGNAVLIDNADKGKVYFCPICNQPLDQKRGPIRIHHFAHKRTRGTEGYVPCSDPWHYDMTEWHIEWQKRFPVECIEKVLVHDNRRHIADVAINDLVIEFQHSHISTEDFWERNRFYMDCGYSVVWVFDLREEVQENRVNAVDNNKFHWTRVKKLFRSLDLKKDKITVYFQFTDDEGDFCLERVTGGYHGFSVFYTDGKNALTIEEFVEKAKELNSSLIPRALPKKEESQKYVNGGRTVFDLWNPEYEWMVVKNLSSGKEMLIRGVNGQLPRQGNLQDGKVIGRYSNKQNNGRYSYSPELYVVWDADKQIWTLKASRRRAESERTPIQDIEGCFSLEFLLMRTPNENAFFCEYNKKTYYFVFTDGRSSMRFNAYEYDPETGEISETHKNPEVQLLKNKKVWRSLKEL